MDATQRAIVRLLARGAVKITIEPTPFAPDFLVTCEDSDGIELTFDSLVEAAEEIGATEEATDRTIAAHAAERAEMENA